MTATDPSPVQSPAAAAGERFGLANGYTLMLAETWNKWRIVDPDGHDQGHIVSQPDRVSAFVSAMAESEEIAKIAARTTERLLTGERLHRLVLEMLDHREHRKDTGVRCGIALAASTIKRGRHLTAEEQLRNLAAGMADGDEQGRTADEWFDLLTRPGALDRAVESQGQDTSAAAEGR